MIFLAQFAEKIEKEKIVNVFMDFIKIEMVNALNALICAKNVSILIPAKLVIKMQAMIKKKDLAIVQKGISIIKMKNVKNVIIVAVHAMLKINAKLANLKIG